MVSDENNGGGSVIGLMEDDATDSGDVRIRYTAYGEAKASPRSDVNGDGAVDTTDRDLVNAAIGASYGGTGYEVELDVDRDGDIDSTDRSLVSGDNGMSIDDGQLSEEECIVGYDGYVFDPATEMYCVRYRWYVPEIGRWSRRDFAGYVDAQNLYQYTKPNPIIANDYSGLQSSPQVGLLINPSMALELFVTQLAREYSRGQIVKILVGMGISVATIQEVTNYTERLIEKELQNAKVLAENIGLALEVKISREIAKKGRDVVCKKFDNFVNKYCKGDKGNRKCSKDPGLSIGRLKTCKPLLDRAKKNMNCALGRKGQILAKCKSKSGSKRDYSKEIDNALAKAADCFMTYRRCKDQKEDCKDNNGDT